MFPLFDPFRRKRTLKKLKGFSTTCLDLEQILPLSHPILPNSFPLLSLLPCWYFSNASKCSIKSRPYHAKGGFVCIINVNRTEKKKGIINNLVSHKLFFQKPNDQIHTLILIVCYHHLKSTYGPALHISALFSSLVSCG